MTSISEQLKSLNVSLEKKYNIGSGELDQYRKIRRFKSLSQYLFYIQPVLNPDEYDEYSIVRLENQYLKVSERLEEIPELADYLYSKYVKISDSTLYEDYMMAIDKKMTELARVYKFSTPPDLLHIDEYMKKYPDFDWKTEVSELFDSLIDPAILLLLNMFRHLVQLSYTL